MCSTKPAQCATVSSQLIPKFRIYFESRQMVCASHRCSSGAWPEPYLALPVEKDAYSIASLEQVELDRRDLPLRDFPS